ncbi:threonine ammonia-lyase IlvA [Nonomuraea glycinis]|uniref:L-threonine dehydratase n=1 Tax=Nonomuraea glycinis TaxID=2047744 RepID=A0A918E2F4_9ACTN|nr:threonine ammonia-lyase IlvA [Nonomuraea glycinis]MCA2175259.1 threonine ammonia-lyase IlvA [Nonomuraea glycinis]GGP00415.1 L-threonine dehydratase [Nonomuraea glycinis]
MTTSGAPVAADAVDEAAGRLAGVVRTTPLERNTRLSDATSAEVWLKREDLQTVRSYKVRGAFNLIAQLDDVARAAGVVAASAGNHAQGVAYACSALGVHGRVYLPRTTPRQKRDRIAALGGSMIETVLGGDTYDEAAAAAAADARATGATIVPAFDDARTIAGQGTVIREAVEQLGAGPDVVVLPVGGGGLLAGSLAWLKERHPRTRVIGVEPEGAAGVAAALAAGEPVTLSEIDTFVDGAAVRRAGDVTFPIIAASDVELVAVPEGRVCSEMLALYQNDGIIAEPAGALAGSALGMVEIPDSATVVCVLSGGNNDVSRYAEVVERALIHEERKHYFLIEFPQEPGALRRFLDEVLGPNEDITLFEYVKHNNRETGPALVGIELASPDDLPSLLKRMEAAPLRIERIDASSPLFRFLL